MRCVSPLGGYSIQVFEGNEQVGIDQRGVMHSVTLSKPVIANFEKGGLSDWEIEAVLTHFNFSGLPEGVNPLTRVAVFDTEAYVEQFPKADREDKLTAIDSRLRELQERFPSEFIIVDKPAVSVPWGSYDTDSVEEILTFQRRLGIDPEHIRLYEAEHERRQEVLDIMARLERGEDVDSVGIEEASVLVNA